MKGKKLDHREESILSMKEQMMMVCLLCGHHSVLKYFLHRVWREVDSNCRKCRIAEETAEHVVHDAPESTIRRKNQHHPTHWRKISKRFCEYGRTGHPSLIYMISHSQESPPPNLPIQSLAPTNSSIQSNKS